MLRRDFISKIIDQLFKEIAKLLNIEVEEETESFLASFGEILKTYFKIDSVQLSQLLDENEERDAFLFDEKIRTTLLILFCQAGLGFHKLDQKEKAEFCLKIIERIQSQSTDVFEFPSEENLKLKDEIIKLELLIINTSK